MKIFKPLFVFIFLMVVLTSCIENETLEYKSLYVFGEGKGLVDVCGPYSEYGQLCRSKYEVEINNKVVKTDIPGLAGIDLNVLTIEKIEQSNSIYYTIDYLNRSMLVIDVMNGQYIFFVFRNEGLYVVTDHSKHSANEIFNRHFIGLMYTP